MSISSCNKNIECPEGKITESINLNKRKSEELSSQHNMKSAASKKNYDHDNVLLDLSNAAMNIIIQLQSDSKSTENVSSISAEYAFAEFIAPSLEKMEEPERTLRRKKIFHDLTALLEHLL